jgi:hypothetical protein
MRSVLVCALIVGSTVAASAQYRSYGTGSNSSDHSVSGYTRNNGTYVQPHYSTSPNATQNDNYGSRGNYNYHTGATGTRSPRY